MLVGLPVHEHRQHRRCLGWGEDEGESKVAGLVPDRSVLLALSDALRVLLPFAIAMDPGDADTYVMLKPRAEWRKKNGRPIEQEKLMELMQQPLAQKVPGQAAPINQPIPMPFHDNMASPRAELGFKIFGDGHPTPGQPPPHPEAQPPGRGSTRPASA